MRSELETFIIEHLNANKRTERLEPSALTIGAEHEFFVNGRDGLPATHEESQELLASLAKEQGWKIQEIEEISKSEKMIKRVSQNFETRYTAVKYDHHPHLLEVAFAYCTNVAELHASALNLFSIIERLAKNLGLSVAHEAFLPLAASHSRTISNLKEFRELRAYRAKLFEIRGQNPDEAHLNYAAVIAATQIHVGNTQWWQQPHYVPHLYSHEPAIIGLTYGLSRSQYPISQRWEGYSKVFADCPLVGYPDLPTWTLETWTQALLQSPLYSHEGADWKGLRLENLDRSPFSTWYDFFKSVRDLQIIRPRLFGTLEFRADPAQPSADALAAVAALRLGISAALLKNVTPTRTFSNSRTHWWRSIKTGVFEDPARVLNYARNGLNLREMSEEVFLEPFLKDRKELRKWS